MKLNLEENITWKKVRACNNSACVEVAEIAGNVLVRNPERKANVARFDHEEWAAFVAGVKAGEFDLS